MNASRASHYESSYPLYSFDWSHQGVIVATYREDLSNQITVLSANKNIHGGDEYDFQPVATSELMYPATKALWDPSQKMSGNGSRFASSSQYLQLWEIQETPGPTSNIINGNNMQYHHGCYTFIVQEKLKLINSKLSHHSLPPLTSFDWNISDPSLVITSSIDTTCTVWDLNRQQVKTQLIAHDSEVFDVKFVHCDVNTFFSVGADGSVRLFDLRALEHSTIIYEPPQTNASITTTANNIVNNSGSMPASNNMGIINSSPLLRLDTCKTNQNLIATIGVDSTAAMVLDIRYPGTATYFLDGHSASINSLAWHPTKEALLTGGDDCQALIWDMNGIVTEVASSAQNSSSQNYHQPGGVQSFPYSQGLGGSASVQDRILKNVNVRLPNNSFIKSCMVTYPDFKYPHQSHSWGTDTLQPKIGNWPAGGAFGNTLNNGGWVSSEINYVGWNDVGDWFGVVSGKEFQGVKSY
ncbi:hypothetical protein DASC09_057220 [Saccharomycopsis crataegensis]|uniref:WD40 repeat-like protein n=1 Tax=Saccharomycopsis crataegensis TaxID=43959 RepID=A0AAV5QWA8_9ASCO|nr:hypothetical protein DASC09_057220 [Saccharomycopsis crataegensis]